MANQNGVPTGDGAADKRARRGPLSRRRVLQLAGVGVAGATAAAATGSGSETNRLEIVASGTAVDYSFTATERIDTVVNSGFTSTESDEESVVENDDGTVTATGRVKKGYADAFSFTGDITSFTPTDGDYRLYLNGEKVSHENLVIELSETREHTYSFEGTGDSWADYYLEVEDGGDTIATMKNGAVIEPEFHWISDDGTKAAGRVDPGERHAYAFDNLVIDVTVEGEADTYVDGSPSDLSWYPQPGATGDGWKSGFPWQEEVETAEDRVHTYSFEGTGDSWADYYLEVEDDSDTIAVTIDGAVIEPEFHWVSEDGTKAAGRVDPGERHAYAFDNSILDVTVEGEADAYVNGEPSDLSWYPRPGATGDGWKGGFPWQDEETATDGLALGGGSGYDNIVTSADADYVVRSASGLQDALGSASSGEVVFVAGDAVIDTGGRSMDVPGGVTLASNRGEGGAAGALLHTEETPQIMLRPKANARVTGLRLRGHSPGETVTYQDGISFDTPTYAMRLEGGDVEVDNCEVWGWPDRAVSVREAGAHVHHNYIYDNNGQGLGYGVAAAAECLIEYNYFHNNRHSVTCAYNAPGYTARYNHFSPVSVMHICDIHDPFQGDTTIASNVIENGESRTWDNPAAEGVAGYPGGFDGGSLSVTDNWFFDQASAYDDGFGAVSDSGNVYGDEGSNDPADVIPDHPGLSDRPWV